MGKTSFTDKEDRFIRENYLAMPLKSIAKELGRSFCGVSGRLRAMGLSVPPEVAAQRRQLGQFKKGQSSPYKGKRQTEFMSPDSIERTKATRFQKGDLPHNARKDGDLELRLGYVWIKVSTGNWVQLHRHIYEKHHRVKLSRVNRVIFIDGNRSNFDINNLKKITNKELMEMNTIHQWPADLKAAIKVLNKLNKQIKEHEK